MTARKEIVQALLDIGEAMLANGAEIKRVEETMLRLGKAYGAASLSVFVITSCLMVTMFFEDESQETQTRRIMPNSSIDFRKLEALNELSRQCAMEPVPIEVLRSKIKECTQEKDDKYKVWFGSMIAAGGFSVFFGGTLVDGAVAMVFAICICLMEERIMHLSANKVVFNLVCSFVIGVGICLTARVLPVLNSDKIIIGDIMLLIPGIPLTNAVKDMMVGDTISGTMRLTEALLWAASLACGFMAAIWLIGG